MKKICKIIMFVTTLFVLTPLTVNAATIKMATTSSASTVVVGNTFNVKITVSSSVGMGTWAYTINYNTKLFKLVSGRSAVADVASNGSTKSITYSYSFKAIAAGTGSIGIKSYEGYIWDKNQVASINASAKSIKVITKQQLEASYSSNNNLSSLSVSGYNISPSFNKNTTNYKVTLKPNVEKISINASVEDKKSSVSGTGTINVSEGENKITITVTSQKGTKKSYTLIATVIDENPIKVNINNVEYVVIKKSSIIPAPSTSYQSKEIIINDQTIPGYYSEITNFTLVGLKDAEGNIQLAAYDSETNQYNLYNEIELEDVKFYSLPYNDEITNYAKTNITINNTTINAFKYQKSSDFALVYGMNVNNGNKGLYVYDSKENTLQRYNDEQIKSINTEISNQKKIINYLIIGSSLLFILLIVLSTKTLIKKKNKNEKKETKKQTKPKQKSDNTIKESKK